MASLEEEGAKRNLGDDVATRMAAAKRLKGADAMSFTEAVREMLNVKYGSPSTSSDGGGNYLSAVENAKPDR